MKNWASLGWYFFTYSSAADGDAGAVRSRSFPIRIEEFSNVCLTKKILTNLTYAELLVFMCLHAQTARRQVGGGRLTHYL